MDGAWLASWDWLRRSYPELILAAACFVLLRRLTGRNPALPFNWPVVGCLPYLAAHADRLHDWSADVLRESGYTFRFLGLWFSGKEILLTCDPANANHVFNAAFANYPKGGDFAEMFDVLGGGIFNVDGESWRRQRRMAHALVSHAGFRAFLARAALAKVRSALVPLLGAAAARGGVVDLQDVFARYSFDATCNLLFGVDPGSLSPEELPFVPFSHAIDVVEEVIFWRHVLPGTWWKAARRLQVGRERSFAEAWKTIDRTVLDYIARIRRRRREDGHAAAGDGEEREEGTDLLTCYLKQQRETTCESDAEFDRFLRDTALNLMIAGRDTTSAGLSWFSWLVATHPDVETKILKELDANLPAVGDTIGSEGFVVFDAGALSRAVYLHAALCEALRLYPPVPFEHKRPVRPEVLPSGEKVSKQSMVVFSLYAMGRMEGIWGKDCGEFRPERWISPETGKVKHEPSYKFLSFNAGPRTCLGKDIAFTQMKAVAAAMIYNFKVDVVPGHLVAPKLSIILHMKDGLKVRVSRR